MELHHYLSRSPALQGGDAARQLTAEWTPVFAPKGTILSRQGDPDTREHIILQGRAIGRILDKEGRAACVGLYAGPCTITPTLARTSAGIARVSLQTVDDALVAQIDSQRLIDLMLASEPVRDWANGVLRDELARKADRE